MGEPGYSVDISRRREPTSDEVAAIKQFQDEIQGTELQQYKILRKVGDGGFAEVFMAETQTGEKIAIKRWSKLNLTSDLVTMFQREVECIRSCDHPNVVKFYGAYTKPVSIVMELVEGRSLFELIHSRYHYDWSFVRQVGYQSAMACEHVHQKGILHRDLKSSNFLLTKQFVVKLCDFGLGRMNPPQDPTGGRGTPFWMAPEVIAHHPYGAASDIFSYGVVMWEMIARETPYDDQENQEIMHIVTAVLRHNLRPTMPPNLPPNVKHLLQMCFAHDPTQRPSWQQIQEFWRSDTCVPPEMLTQRVERWR